MKKEYILSKSPPLKIILDKNQFEIINKQYTEGNGIFLYSKLYEIKFQEKSTNHSSTVLSFILGLFIPGRAGKIMNYRENIFMNYNGRPKKVILMDFDKMNVIEVIAQIQTKMNPKYLRKN